MLGGALGWAIDCTPGAQDESLMLTATITNTKAGILAPFHSRRGAKRVLVWSTDTRSA